VPAAESTSDFDELLAILELSPIGDDVFAGAHPHKNPVRTFGGQMMAQAFVAATRTLVHDLPPSALSVHFIAGGDPSADIEFHVGRLRDERRFANRRVDAMQDGKLLATALSTTSRCPRCPSRTPCRRLTTSLWGTRRSCPAS
jgi:acyl-CoA thioesterase II